MYRKAMRPVDGIIRDNTKSAGPQELAFNMLSGTLSISIFIIVAFLQWRPEVLSLHLLRERLSSHI